MKVVLEKCDGFFTLRVDGRVRCVGRSLDLLAEHCANHAKPGQRQVLRVIERERDKEKSSDGVLQ